MLDGSVVRTVVATLKQILGVAVDGSSDILYLLDNSCSIYKISLSTNKIIVSKSLSLPTTSQVTPNIIFRNGFLYVISNKNGKLLKIDENLNIVWSKSLDIDDNYKQLYNDDNFLYLASYKGKLLKFDINGNIVKAAYIPKSNFCYINANRLVTAVKTDDTTISITNCSLDSVFSSFNFRTDINSYLYTGKRNLDLFPVMDYNQTVTTCTNPVFSSITSILNDPFSVQYLNTEDFTVEKEFFCPKKYKDESTHTSY